MVIIEELELKNQQFKELYNYFLGNFIHSNNFYNASNGLSIIKGCIIINNITYNLEITTDLTTNCFECFLIKIDSDTETKVLQLYGRDQFKESFEITKCITSIPKTLMQWRLEGKF